MAISGGDCAGGTAFLLDMDAKKPPAQKGQEVLEA
jgi:hypothetical protein